MDSTASIDFDTLHGMLRSGPARAAASGLAVAALRDIADGRRELPAIRHPLGFLCLPLVRDGLKGVCVHLFDGGSGPGPEPLVHAHSWALTSLVLHGRVTNLSVRVRDRPAAPTHRVFEVHSEPDGADEVRPTARLVHSEPLDLRRNGSGEVYTVQPGEFHATMVEGGRPAATLVLGRSLPGRTDLSLGPLHGGGHRSVRGACNRPETVSAVQTALRRINARDD
ncbi:hypothetical protein ACFO3J_23555 [Streptomyces polygonati]|uniref:Cysteine dioxygenase n=1 Tax=Streptomyces polygonati TaxID=1617087 RepID=A0ABV8HRU0_9ACTN